MPEKKKSTKEADAEKWDRPFWSIYASQAKTCNWFDAPLKHAAWHFCGNADLAYLADHEVRWTSKKLPTKKPKWENKRFIIRYVRDPKKCPEKVTNLLMRFYSNVFCPSPEELKHIEDWVMMDRSIAILGLTNRSHVQEDLTVIGAITFWPFKSGTTLGTRSRDIEGPYPEEFGPLFQYPKLRDIGFSMCF